jgi:hypothetical protein
MNRHKIQTLITWSWDEGSWLVKYPRCRGWARVAPYAARRLAERGAFVLDADERGVQ